MLSGAACFVPCKVPTPSLSFAVPVPTKKAPSIRLIISFVFGVPVEGALPAETVTMIKRGFC